MAVRTTTDPGEIAARVGAKLAEDPVLHTVLGTVRDDTDGLRATGWCAWEDSGALAARASADYPITVTGGWADLSGLAEALAATPSVAGLAGPSEVVDEAAARLGRPIADRTAQRLFRLDELTEPAHVPGRARLATIADLDRVAGLLGAFLADVRERVPPEDELREHASRVVLLRRPWLWTDDDATVSIAVEQPACDGVARVGPVYTPPDCRGHGYASAVTAHATRQILLAGAVPVLFTDLANPTSNKIYQALGYRPVADRVHVIF